MVGQRSGEQIFDVVSPAGDSVVERRPLSAPLDTLDGRTIGLVWNKVFRGDETLPMIAEMLQERFPTARFVPWDDFPVTSVPALHAERQAETLECASVVVRV